MDLKWAVRGPKNYKALGHNKENPSRLMHHAVGDENQHCCQMARERNPPSPTIQRSSTHIP